MGYSAWSDEAYRSVSAGRSSSRPTEIFRGEQSIDPLMDPRGLRVREARDSEHHPNSVPIVVGFDVTGSMGHIPTRFAQEMLGALMRRLVENGWVTDPQLCFAAIGDAVSDRAPLQVGQFESGLEMDMWLTRIWLEGRGGDLPESYLLAHWFVAHHTATDAWEKRGKKGYLFTIGDAPNKGLDANQIRRVFGGEARHPTGSAEVIAAASERWELFHILVNVAEGSDLIPHWRALLGERVLVLDHVDAICELIGVAIGRREGALSAEQALSLLRGAGMAAAASRRVVESLG